MTKHEFPLSEDFRNEALGVGHLWNMPQVVADYLATGNLRLRSEAYALANAECFRLADAQLEAARNGKSWAGMDKAHAAASAARACASEAVFGESFADAMAYISGRERAVIDGVRDART